MFFILGYPRSRTAWLANFFTYGPCFCYHEPTLECGSLDHLAVMDKQTPALHVGFSDPSLVLLADRLIARYPFAPRIVIHRPVEVVRASCARVGIPMPDTLPDLHALGGMHVTFDALNTTHCLEALWWYATGSLDGWCERRARMLIDMNVQSKLEETSKRVDPAKVTSLFGRR